jgi:hypothetical protein
MWSKADLAHAQFLMTMMKLVGMKMMGHESNGE